MNSDTSLSQTASLRVVAVDDHVDTLSMLELLLGSLGWDVRTAATGEDALRLVEQDRPDVILSDVNIPDMDGIELIRVVRQRLGEHLPAIALTGAFEPEDIDALTAAGFDGYVTKPITVAALTATVRRVLGS